MSNPEKAIMDTEEEIIEGNSDDSDHAWSELEEGEIRELVLALPALRVGERFNADEELRQNALIAANLVVAAAQEAAVATGTTEPAVATGTTEPAVAMELAGGDTGKKKLGRPRKVRLEDLVAEDGASGSIEGEAVKKPRKKGSSVLNHPPQGPVACNICGKAFGSWKAVFGHLRSHKDRGYQGFLPPPTFNAAEEGFGGVVAGSSGGGGLGYGTGGLEIDLNVDPVENEEEATGSGSSSKFDLNRSPPHEEEEEKEGDKAE